MADIFDPGLCDHAEWNDGMPESDRQFCANCQPTYPPVQLCPICGCAGEFVGARCGPLALDAECTSCGWFYTTTARKAVLAALSR